METTEAFWKRQIALQRKLEEKRRQADEEKAYELIAARASKSGRVPILPTNKTWRQEPGHPSEARALVEAATLYPAAAQMIERRARNALSEKHYLGVDAGFNYGYGQRISSPMTITERQKARGAIGQAAKRARQQSQDLKKAAMDRLDPTGRHRQVAELKAKRKSRDLQRQVMEKARIRNGDQKFADRGKGQRAHTNIGAFTPSIKFNWYRNAALAGRGKANQRTISTVKANRLGYESRMAAKRAIKAKPTSTLPGKSEKYKELYARRMERKKALVLKGRGSQQKQGNRPFASWSRHQDQKRMSDKEVAAIREASKKVKATLPQQKNPQTRRAGQLPGNEASRGNSVGIAKTGGNRMSQPRVAQTISRKSQSSTAVNRGKTAPVYPGSMLKLKNAVTRKWQQAKEGVQSWSEKTFRGPQKAKSNAMTTRPLKNSQPSIQQGAKPASVKPKSTPVQRPKVKTAKPAAAPSPKKNYANAKKPENGPISNSSEVRGKHQKKDVPSRSLGKDASRASNLATKVRTAKPAAAAQRKKAVAQM